MSSSDLRRSAVVQGERGSRARCLTRSGPDGAVSIVDGRTLAPRATFPVVDTGGARSVGFVPGSHLLVVGGGGEDGFLALVDADSGRLVRRLAGHRGQINVPGISADGSLLSTSDRDGGVRFWSLPDGSALGALRFTGEIFTSQLSPDGRHLTVVRPDAGAERSTVEVWDVPSRRRVRTLRFDEPVIARFSPDARSLAVGTRSGRSQVWSTETWKPRTRFLAGDGGGLFERGDQP